MDNLKKSYLGDLLVKNQLISPEQLQTALLVQKKIGKKLGQTLLSLEFIDEVKLLDMLSKQLQIPFVDLSKFQPRQEVIKNLPEKIARRFRVLLLEDNSSDVLLGMVDPTDLMGLDELSRILGKTIRPVFVEEKQLLNTIDQSYRRTDEIKVLAEQLRYELRDNDADLNVLLASDKAADAPVVKLLKSVFEDAVQVRASDIHIEPQEHKLLIRFRIDGQLQLQTEADLKIASALVQKLKLMAGLDISEKRLPHDGRFHVKVRQQSVDIRISTLPTVYGESVVMRLLMQSMSGFSLEKLGMPHDMLARYRHLINRPNGMVLLTGPTGSGKSTTLYASLSELNKSTRKIITVEDPVEYRLSGINQVQVNEKIELDFARVLRSALRQDPDIIFIGEMRDQETAQIGMRAAMTGHLVLSTLHTNGTISTPSRMVDMGVKPFMVGMSLLAIIAQRLVRLVCESCARPYYPNPFEEAWLKLELGESIAGYNFIAGKGCQHCHHTGYRGRVGIYEMLEMNNELVEAIIHGETQKFADLAREQLAKNTLRYNAIMLAITRRTSVTEAMWVSNQFGQ